MRFLTLLFLLIYQYGLGYTLTRSLGPNTFSKFILRLGVGLACLPGLGIVLNILRVPLDWKVFLFLALIVPLYDLKKQWKKPGPVRDIMAWAKAHAVEIGVVVLFLLNVWIYCSGPFAYPWLEDDDPWTHAVGMKYVALEKNVRVAPGQFHYINPYPPGYDITLGILHQTSPSLYWTMKFFNGFIVALSFLFFYLVVFELSQDKRLGLASLFILTCLPCYLSHFIWAHALAVTLFFPAFYCLLRCLRERGFLFPGIICVAGIFFTQPTQSLKFVIMAALLLLTIWVSSRKWPSRGILILSGGLIVSLLWYGPVLKDVVAGSSRLALRDAANPNITQKTKSVIPRLFGGTTGSATKKYTVADYVHVSERNRINNPMGIGVPATILGLQGLVFNIMALISKKRRMRPSVYSWTILLWLGFTFLGMNSATFHLPVGLFAFRFWMLFAIPVAILSGEMLLWLLAAFVHRRLRFLFLVAMVVWIVVSTGYYKYSINTCMWAHGVYWQFKDELRTYIWMRRNLPVNTKVFAFVDNFFVIGHDMLAMPWTEEYQEAFHNSVDLPLNELYRRLRSQGYEYVIVGQREAEKLGREKVNQLLGFLDEHRQFELIYNQGNGARIFRLVDLTS